MPADVLFPEETPYQRHERCQQMFCFPGKYFTRGMNDASRDTVSPGNTCEVLNTVSRGNTEKESENE